LKSSARKVAHAGLKGLTTFFKKKFKVRFFKIDPTSVEQHQKVFLNAAKGAVATARYYFYSVTGAVAPLLNLTTSGSGSNVFNKVAVAHLCLYIWCPCWGYQFSYS